MKTKLFIIETSLIDKHGWVLWCGHFPRVQLIIFTRLYLLLPLSEDGIRRGEARCSQNNESAIYRKALVYRKRYLDSMTHLKICFLILKTKIYFT